MVPSDNPTHFALEVSSETRIGKEQSGENLNDATVTKILSPSFDAHFGKNKSFPLNQTIPGSEDFSTLATAIDRPYCFWFFGGHDAVDWDKRKREGRLGSVPVNHSARFAPAIQPTLKTGTEALVVAALTMLSDVSV